MSNIRYEKVTSHWSPAAGLVLRRAASLAGDRTVDIITLVAALDTDIPPRTTTTLRQPLTERLLALTGGSRRAAGGVVTIADVFGRKPSSLVSR